MIRKSFRNVNEKKLKLKSLQIAKTKGRWKRNLKLILFTKYVWNKIRISFGDVESSSAKNLPDEPKLAGLSPGQDCSREKKNATLPPSAKRIELNVI